MTKFISNSKISEAQAEEAFKTILQYIGEDINREGLKDTPKRFIRNLHEYFQGYNNNPEIILKHTYGETSDYNGMVVLNDIEFISHCEHHFLPIVGKACVAYIPDRRVVGISKLARLVHIYAQRLQLQERMNAQIAQAIHDVLQPKGVAVGIVARHYCMSSRGVKTLQSSMSTTMFLGAFENNDNLKDQFVGFIKKIEL